MTRPRSNLVDGVVLALLPVGVFLVMRVQPMARVQSIDPTFYTAYIDNGPDMIHRFGTDRYYWARVGQTLPGRLANLTFGEVGGFFVLRYSFTLFASVPAYLLVRRTYRRGPALLAALVLLTNPVVLRAWTSDYPDGAAVAYLAAGTCCLVMPSARRLPWLLAAGAFLTLAAHSTLFAAVLVLAIVAGWAVGELRLDGWRPGLRTVLRGSAVLSGAFLVVSLGLAVLAEVVIGAGNLLHTNQMAIEEVRSGLLDQYHSDNWRWVLRNPQLLVLPMFLALWGVLRVLDGAVSSRAERAVVTIVAFQLAGCTVWQFFAGGQAFENHLYASMLWAGGLVLLSFVLARLWVLIADQRWLLVAGACIVGVPLLVRSAWPDLRFFVWPGAILVAVAVVAAIAAGRALRSRAPVLVAASSTLAVVAAAYVLVAAKPLDLPLLEGQALQPQPSYGDVFLNDDDTYLENYRVITDLPDLLPTVEEEPGKLQLWWPGDSPDIVQYAAAMYLWRINALMGFNFEDPGLPLLNDAQSAAMRTDPDTRFVLLLGATDDAFDAGVQALDDAGFEPEAGPVRELSSGDSTLFAQVVELGAAS